MTWQRSFLFRMIVFLTFFQLVCLNNSRSKFEVPGPAKKENVKCITNQIKEDDSTFQLLTDIFELDKRQKNPVIERRVPEGTDFMYECRNLKKEAIFKWGLYKRGVSSPSRLFSRVEVAKAKSSCSVSWPPDFKDTRYHGRIHVEYNTTSQCVIWIMSSVTREDENIFVAIVRDNFAQGQGFRECTPVSLNVIKAETPVPATPPLQTTPVTPKKPETSPTTPEPTSPTTTATSKPSPPDKSLNSNWLYFLLVLVLPIAVVLQFKYIKCWRKRKYQLRKTIQLNEASDNPLLKEV